MPPFPDDRARRVLICIVVVANVIALSAFGQQQKKLGRKKAQAARAARASATPQNGQVPLPVGHEAKGLTFPDFDEDGHLRGQFAAGTARRADPDHMEFHDLKITTFTDNEQVDLQVVMAESVLDMNTHVLSSSHPTTIKRTDFEIVGDTARFDTTARQGTLTGNVKMTITDAAKYSGQKPK